MQVQYKLCKKQIFCHGFGRRVRRSSAGIVCRALSFLVRFFSLCRLRPDFIANGLGSLL